MPNPSAHTLLRANADLSPAIIARAVAKRLHKMGVPGDVAARMDAHLAVLDAKDRAMQTLTLASDADRQPWFCSGCPHNTSTKVPEGSRAMAGIGCHFMTIWMDRATVGFTQMGGEGVPWVGQAAVQHRPAHLCQPWRWHLFPQRPAGRAPEPLQLV
jgi:indolepyruvate ferredoxin oxidoreductase